MPNIDRLLEERAKKKFTKKSYRPWDLSGAHNNPVSVVEDNIADDKTIDSNIEENTKPVFSEKVDPILPSTPAIQVKPQPVKSTPAKKPGFTPLAKPHVVSEKPVGDKLPNDPNQNLQKTIKQLRGNEKKLFLLVIEICSKKEGLSTGELSSEEFDRMLSMTRNSRETVIKRLQKKGILRRQVGKKGLNGTLTLSVPGDAYEHALQYFANNQFDNVLAFTKNSIGVPNTVVSSQDKAEEGDALSLPLEWREINIEPLRHSGLSLHHLIQLFKRDTLTPKMVQDSIDAFAFDLEHNDKAKTLNTSPVNFLMGVLRKGPYTPPDNYESPEARLMRLYNERQATIQKQKEAEEEKWCQVEFDKWLVTLSEKEKEALLPAEIKRFKIEAPRMTALKAYFRENLFGAIKQEVMGSLDNTNQNL